MIEVRKGRKIRAIRQMVEGVEFCGRVSQNTPQLHICSLLIAGRRGNSLPLPPLLCVRLLCCQKGAEVCKWAQRWVEAEAELGSRVLWDRRERD